MMPAGTALQVAAEFTGMTLESYCRLVRKFRDNLQPFLARDAMRKRGLCGRAVSVRPSRSCTLWKRVIISSIFFTIG